MWKDRFKDGKMQVGWGDNATWRDLTPLEKEFMETHKEAQEKIAACMEMANKYIDDACKIAKETGIPFQADVSPLSQTYTPDKWAELKEQFDERFLENMEVYEGEWEGWEHSAVC